MGFRLSRGGGTRQKVYSTSASTNFLISPLQRVQLSESPPLLAGCLSIPTPYGGILHHPHPLWRGLFLPYATCQRKLLELVASNSRAQMQEMMPGPRFAPARNSSGGISVGMHMGGTPGVARGRHFGGFPRDIWTASAEGGFGRGTNEFPRAYCGASEQKGGLI